MGMKGIQRYRRVLFSRWGAFCFLSYILLSYLTSFIEMPNEYEAVKKSNPFPLIIIMSQFYVPFFIWLYALGKIDEQDARQFLEENPHLKNELKEGESLIDFLYEDEEEK